MVPIWTVPIFLFCFHADVESYLWTLARDADRKRQIFGGFGSDFIGLSLDDDGEVVRLIAGETKWRDRLTQSSVERPDRIVLGELRGVEAFTFLRAVNTGHPGSMTTIHADTPQRAIEQLALLVLQAGSKLSRDDVRLYMRESIDVFVKLERRGGQPRAGGGVAGGGAGGAVEPV